MDRKLVFATLLFFVFIAAFIFVMINSELKNFSYLRATYPKLSEDVYNLRRSSMYIWGIRLFLSFLLPYIFLVSKFSQRISVLVGEKHGLFLSGLFYGIIIFGIIFLVNLPLNFYSGFYLRHKFGLTDQSILRWLELNLKSFLVNDIVTSLFLWFPYLLLFHMPNNWYMVLGVIGIPVIIFLVFISPFVIDPFFNDYHPMEEGSLKDGIQILLEEAGIEDANIFVVDKSKDTKTMNAYVTGIFSAKRIVLWDTTINNLTEDEVISITAHEIGHYVKGHIWKGIIAGVVGLFVLLYLIHVSASWVLDSSRGEFGFKNIYNYASLPIFLILLNLLLLLGQPVSNTLSRYFEREADLYEISITKDRQSAVTAMEKLYESSLGVPKTSQIFNFWYRTHPDLEDRIKFYLDTPFEEIGGK